MGNIFFTSDHHFGHTNIIRHANRPFASVEEMDEALITNWNNLVGRSDTVYHLGDFSFHRRDKTAEILDRLNGAIHLVKGNHDRRMHSSLFRMFQSVSDLKEIKVADQSIVLCHYAMRVWNKSHYGAWQLHGHSHGTLQNIPTYLQFDVGVDCWGYLPISFDSVKVVMENKTWQPVDHHGRNQ